jgi:hypothetical protein
MAERVESSNARLHATSFSRPSTRRARLRSVIERWRRHYRQVVMTPVTKDTNVKIASVGAFFHGRAATENSRKLPPGAGDRPIMTALLSKSGAAVWAILAAYFYFRQSEHHLRITADALNNVNWNFQKLQYFSLFQTNGINPYQGIADAWSPSAPWLRLPEVVLWFLGVPRTAVPAEYAVYFTMFTLATYSVGRTIAPNDSANKIALMSFAVGLLLFPPITFAYFPSLALFAVVPFTSFAAAVTLVLLALWIKLDAERLRDRILISAALVVVALYGIATEPLWIAALTLFAMPFFAVMTILPFDRQSVMRRTLAGIVLVGLFYATGAIDYVLSTLAYTSRTYFAEEVAPTREINVLYFARDPGAFHLLLVMLVGITLALFHRARRVRGLAIASFLMVICCFIYDLAWLFYPGTWSLPLPTYATVITTPIFGLVALFGWMVPFTGAAAFLRHGGFTRDFRDVFFFGNPTLRKFALLVVSPWLLVPLILSAGAVLYCWALPHNGPPDYALLRRPPASGSVGEYLKNETAIVPGSRYRGSTALQHEFATDLRLDLMDAWEGRVPPYEPAIALWTSDIPTYDEYSAMISPPAYYVMSRLASDLPYQFRNAMPYPGTSELNFKVLQAAGVRFFLTKKDIEGSAIAQLRRNFKSQVGDDAFVYELSDPNRDGFSVTRVHVERVAQKYLALLASDNFQFRTDVVLTEPIDESLVPVKKSRLYFTSRGPRIVASSPGKSLLVLPVQYSNCLEFRTPTTARLVRANLFQVGVLFEGSIDATFDLSTGPLSNPRCRKADVDDARDLQIKVDGRVAIPPAKIRKPYVGTPILPFLRTHFSILLFQ